VQNITANAEHAAIVRSLIAMAHNLGLTVIAEGVETPAQAAFLLQERCEEAQGFLYAKPLPADEFEAYLRARQNGFQPIDLRLDQIEDDGPEEPSAALSPRRRRFPRI
jgi:sensor c-di-GMP phosphodiesterase-like protein